MYVRTRIGKDQDRRVREQGMCMCMTTFVTTHGKCQRRGRWLQIPRCSPPAMRPLTANLPTCWCWYSTTLHGGTAVLGGTNQYRRYGDTGHGSTTVRGRYSCTGHGGTGTPGALHKPSRMNPPVTQSSGRSSGWGPWDEGIPKSTLLRCDMGMHGVGRAHWGRSPVAAPVPRRTCTRLWHTRGCKWP
jgi:hypothetical protein